MKITRIGLCPYRVPLGAPVRGVAERTGWWIAVVLDDGAMGLGDVACWAGFGAGEAEVKGQLESIGRLHGASTPDSVLQLDAWLVAEGWLPEVRHGVSLALLDALGRSRGLSLATLLCGALGGMPEETIWLHRQVSTATEATAAIADGVSALKIKVAQGDLHDDMARISAIRAAAPSASLRLDANGRWPLGEAPRILKMLADFDIAWVEQPVAGLKDFLTLAKLDPPITLAADECITDEAALQAVLAYDAVETVVLKPMFLGGPVSTVRMARMATEAGRQVVITHALESAVGRAGAVQAAAAVGEGLNFCGLGAIGSAPISIAVDDAPGHGLDLGAFTNGHDGAGWRWWGARS
ncbi:MAG: enolase C-terminal domain-like protein [Bradymonadia bacterium]